MTPLERAARVLCRLDGLDPDADYQPRTAEGIILDVASEQPAWKQFRHKARAVLQAIREPSEGMVEAASDRTTLGYDAPPGDVWQAMIDAALKEG